MAKTSTIKKQDVELIRLLRDTERRRGIDPLEEAEAFNRLLATGYVPTQIALAAEVCRTPQYIYGRMVLYEAPEALRQRIAGHESTRTTQLYNRLPEEVSLDEIERIHI